MSIKKDIKKVVYLLKNKINASKYKKAKELYFNQNYTNTKRLIIFFVPSGSNRISGGILSICSIYRIVKNLKQLHNSDVIASYLPNKKDDDFKYRTFENEMIIYNFHEIEATFLNLEYLQIHIPEIMVSVFKDKEAKLKSFYEFIKKIKTTELNILNQNDLFMPSLDHINFLKSKFNSATITVAHKKYATLEKREKYNLPIHLLSPWLNPVPYKVRSYEEKENLIIYSPDKIQWIPNETLLTKNEIIKNLESKLPNYLFKEIKDLKYDDYKELASKAKFSITFGEGLDGYFTETVFSGGISFAVYNEYFFSEEFKNLETLFYSFNDLSEKIVDKIKSLDNKAEFDKVHQKIGNIVNKIYSLNHLENDLKEYYTKKYDFE
jgi:hypothetical protein